MDVNHNKKNQEFFIELSNEEKAILKYIWDGFGIAPFEIVIPKGQNEKELGNALMEAAVMFVQQSSLRIKPRCEFAIEYMKSQTHLQHMVDYE